MPFWWVSSGDSSSTFVCKAYGTCNANGMQEYFPPYAHNQCYSLDGGENNCNYDYHAISVDNVYNHGEIDGWECGPGSVSGGSLSNCQWGGFFPFNSSGLTIDLGDNGTSVAAGYAAGLTQLTPLDLSDPVITHALGVVVSCTSNPTVYPSSMYSSDSVCGGGANPNVGGGPEPTPSIHYGDIVFIKPSVDVAGLGGGAECQKILTAIQTYGMYIEDTSGGYGISMEVEPYNDYVLAGVNPNPWDAHITAMDAAGDGKGTGAGFNLAPCLKRIGSASNLEVIELNQAGSKALPP